MCVSWPTVERQARENIVRCGCLYNNEIYLYNIMFSIYFIASESNQVCLWLPYVLNTTKSRLFFPILLRVAWQWAWRDDVCSAVYRHYLCTNCTITQCLLPALKGEGRFASILIGCAKTDGPVTGNITGSFCIFLLANTAWPSYSRIARSISNKIMNIQQTSESKFTTQSFVVHEQLNEEQNITNTAQVST